MAEKAHTFDQEIRAIADGIRDRVQEVGLEQAAEEYWERAKIKLHAMFEENDAYRKEHGIPEDEL